MENMNFEQFKNWSEETIHEHMPHLHIEFHNMEKLGGSYIGLVGSTGEQSSATVVNLTELYSKYLDGEELQQIRNRILSTVVKYADIKLEWAYDYSFIRNRLFVRISNFEKNREFLQKVPYTNIVDLALTYHIQIELDDDMYGNVIITNEMLLKYHITKAELHSDAMENAKSLCPPYIFPLQSYITGNTELHLSHDQNSNIIVITNHRQNFGASSLFYPQMLDSVSKILGKDYYLIPSSIHEWIACQCNDESRYHLIERTLRETNQRYVEDDEWLSDEIYHYDGVKHIFEHAESYRSRVK